MKNLERLSKKEIIHIHKLSSYDLNYYEEIFYFDLETTKDFEMLLSSIQFSSLKIHMIIMKDFKERLEEIISPIQLESMNFKKNGEVLVSFCIERGDFLENDLLLNHIYMQGEMNSYLYLIADPNENLEPFNYTDCVLRVDINSASMYIIFDFDADGLIIIK